MTFLLLPSPLLGPVVWAPVATWLRGQGHAVEVAVVEPSVWQPADVLARLVEIAQRLPAAVLVPHSNAGLYAPQVAELAGAGSVMYVDAALPTTEPETPLAPPALLEQLRSLADADGVLPPWTRWWDDLDGLFPDAATRAEIETEQRRLPLAYFTSRLPVPRGWAELPSAYLSFGDTYAEEVAFARGRSWPVTTLPGRHLHLLVDPAAVGAAILGLRDSTLTG